MDNSTTNSDHKKILLIEDDYHLEDIYKNFLETDGYTVTVAPDGLSGYEKAVSEKPDVILLDIMLPVMNGLNALKKIKENESTKKSPVVLITNLGQEEIIEQAFKIGAQGYILKVRSTPEELLKTVKTYIENPDYVVDLKSIME